MNSKNLHSTHGPRPGRLTISRSCSGKLFKDNQIDCYDSEFLNVDYRLSMESLMELMSELKQVSPGQRQLEFLYTLLRTNIGEE